jgi:hypothetical protein
MESNKLCVGGSQPPLYLLRGDVHLGERIDCLNVTGRYYDTACYSKFDGDLSNDHKADARQFELVKTQCRASDSLNDHSLRSDVNLVAGDQQSATSAFTALSHSRLVRPNSKSKLKGDEPLASVMLAKQTFANSLTDAEVRHKKLWQARLQSDWVETSHPYFSAITTAASAERWFEAVIQDLRNEGPGHATAFVRDMVSGLMQSKRITEHHSFE